MVQRQALQFQQISDLLQRPGSTGNAAEDHGVLCGLLCSQGYSNGKAWFTHDLMEISRASSDTLGSEGDEAAYLELVEYIRVGIQLLYEELQPAQTKTEQGHGPTLR